jgi:hypothetical protein
MSAIHMKALSIFCLIALGAALVGCGGGSAGADIASTKTGSFINSPTKGIRYVASPSGLTGLTDENGRFSYRAGDTVTFSLQLGGSNLTLGSLTNPGAENSVLSLSVSGNGSSLAIAQLLETLDRSQLDGKMDVSEVTLPTNSALRSGLANALGKSTIPSEAITSIAASVQEFLNASGIRLKYGSVGVTANQALNNLAVNPVNRPLVESKVEAMQHDGISTILTIQDRPSFVNIITTRSGKTEYEGLFGVIRSNLEWDFRAPSTANSDYVKGGTYTLSNSNKTGNFTVSGNLGGGLFEMKSADSEAFTFTTYDNTYGDFGSSNAVILKTVTLNDVYGKTFRLIGGCGNGTDNVLTVNTSGVSSDSCGTELHGATWSTGPFDNVLRIKPNNGKNLFVGITRIEKSGQGGNLPSGATGSFIGVSNTNYNVQPLSMSFVIQ